MKAQHRRRRVGRQTERASQLSRAKTCAGWTLTCYTAIRSLPDGSISGLLRKSAMANPFTRASCYSWSSKERTSTTVWQNIRSIRTFLQPPAIDKELDSNAKLYLNQMAWWNGANFKAHISSRSFPCEIPVRGRFFERRFQPLSVEGFFSSQREIGRWPKNPFPSKTQNWQIARTSPSINQSWTKSMQNRTWSPSSATMARAIYLLFLP